MSFTPDLYEEGKSITIPSEELLTPPPEPTTEDPGTLESEIATADEEIESELAETSESEPEEPVNGHRSKAAEKRIKQLVAERNQLMALLENQQKLALYQSGQSPNQSPQPPQEQVVDPAQPNPANYTNDVDYLVDMKFYQRELKAKQERFQSKQAELLILHPEIPELVEESNRKASRGVVTNSPAMELLISDSEQPTELWFYLLSHQDEAEQIAKLTPLRAAKAVGLIEQKLLPPTTEIATPHRLPPPINPVKVTKSVSRTSSVEAY